MFILYACKHVQFAHACSSWLMLTVTTTYHSMLFHVITMVYHIITSITSQANMLWLQAHQIKHACKHVVTLINRCYQGKENKSLWLYITIS